MSDYLDLVVRLVLCVFGPFVLRLTLFDQIKID